MNRNRILSRGLVRQRGKMNQTEEAFAYHLESRDDVHRWKFEPLSFRLSSPPAGQPARYTPDFVVVFKDGSTVFYDVKGPRNRHGKAFDDPRAVTAIKCAAEQFDYWRFVIVRKGQHGWDESEV